MGAGLGERGGGPEVAESQRVIYSPSCLAQLLSA